MADASELQYRSLTSDEDILIGREPRGILDFILDEKKAEELFAALHMKRDPRAKVADLSIAKQHMVEIAKALSFNAEALAVDHSTVADHACCSSRGEPGPDDGAAQSQPFERRLCPFGGTGGSGALG